MFHKSIFIALVLTAIVWSQTAPTLVSPVQNSTNVTIPVTLKWSVGSEPTVSYCFDWEISKLPNWVDTIPYLTGYAADSVVMTTCKGGSDDGADLKWNAGPYYWRVAVVYVIGQRAYYKWSESKCFYTTSPPAPLLVSPANGAAIDTTRWDLVWNQAIGAADYEVQVSTAINFPSVTGVTVAQLLSTCDLRVYVDTLVSYLNDVNDSVSLPKYSTYYWRVCSVVAGGTLTSAWSEVRSFIVVRKPTTPIASHLRSIVPSTGASTHVLRLVDLLGRNIRVTRISRIVVGQNAHSIEIR